MTNLHPLWQQVQRVGRQARLTVVAVAISGAMLAILAATIIALSFDFALQWPTGEGRWAFTITWWTAVIVAIASAMRMIGSARWQPFSLARRIEDRFPHLRPQISTAVDFLEPKNHRRSGSPQLQRAVADNAWLALQKEDISRVVDRERAKILLGAATLFVVLLALAAACFPKHAAVGLQRLLLPWDNTRWPNQQWLEVEQAPASVTRGGNVEFVFIEQNDNLPKQAALYIRWADDGRIESRPLQLVDERLVAHLDRVTRSFSFRAVGGDDHSMPWQTVDVVDPLRVQHEELTVVPPEYLHTKPYIANSPAEIIAGSQLRWTGKLDAAARSIVAKNVSTKEISPGTIAADGISAEIPAKTSIWQPTTSGPWQIEVIDAAGRVVLGPRIEFTLVADPQPTVRWSNDRELIAWPKSIVSVDLQAADPQGLQKVAVEICQGKSLLREQTVYEAKGRAGEGNQSFTAELDLSRIASLEPGTDLQLIATARDARPNADAVRSAPRTFRIVSADELEQRLLEALPDFKQQIADAIRLQEAAHEKIGFIANLKKAEADRVPALIDEATLAQRQVNEHLTHRERGLLPKLERWLAEWKSHRLPLPVAAESWQMIAAEGREVEQNLLDQLPERIAAISPAKRFQDCFMIAMVQDSILQHVRKWADRGDAGEAETKLFRELLQVRQDQADVARRTEDLRVKQLASLAGEDVDDAATAEEQKSLSLAEWELARRTDRVQAGVFVARRVSEGNPLSDAFSQAALGTQMRTTARDLEQALWSAAADRQQEIRAALDRILKLWRPDESGQSAAEQEQLSATAKQIAAWQAEQHAAVEEWQKALAAATSPLEKTQATAPFVKKMSALTEAIQNQSRAWQNPQTLAVRDHLAAAAKGFDAAAVTAGDGEFRKALTAAAEGAEALEAAKNAVMSAVDAARQQALATALEKLIQELQTLAKQQEAIFGSTIKLNAARAENQSFTRPQLAQLEQLAADQSSLEQATRSQAEAAPLGAFQVFLNLAGDEMHQAADRLAQQQTDNLTRRHQQQALKQLQLLLEQSRKVLEAPSELAEGDPPDQANQRPSDKAGKHSLTEFRLVAETQKQIAQRNTGLKQLPPETRNVERQSLARQQQAIADLMTQWAKEIAPDVEVPKPKMPAIAQAAKEAIDLELNGGEDIGEKSPPALVVFARRMQLAAALQPGETTHAAAIPLQQVLVQDLDSFIGEQQLQRQRAQSNKRPNSDKPGENTSNTGEPDGGNNTTSQQPRTQAKIDPQTLARLKQTIWGHLPPQVQEQLQQAAEADFLPQYERQIREYYRRMAE